MKKIPYGISNFKELRNLNMYYIDKTMYIEKLEDKDRYVFFIRPRRFGKSLFLTMLEAYYDMNEEPNFEKYFGDLYVEENRTEQANKYIVLKISFASVITDLGKDELIESFDKIVSSAVDKCIIRYKHILEKEELPQDERRATYALKYLSKIVELKNKKIVLLIDEYDNFANNIMRGKQKIYEELMHEGGYVRTFYKEIKEGTGDGAITRTFITGVSPMMLDDVTSGANIFTVIANDKDLNNILGFNDEEIKEIVDYYKIGEIVNKEELFKILKTYCNGYKFNESVSETVYNTDMVLYILNNIIQKKEYPKKLIDENVKTDYTRLRNIAENFITKEEMLDIIEGGEVGPIEIKERFNLESLYKKEEKYTNIRSLLYYLGMLTIKRQEANAVILGVPNYAVKALYWEYMEKAYGVEASARYDELKAAMRKMREEGKVEHIMEIYERVIKRLSNRDLTYFNETSCKSIFITLVYTDGVYLIESEKETNGGYTDLYIKEGVLYKEAVKYRCMIEFKHIKEGELKTENNQLGYTDEKERMIESNIAIITKKKQEARKQLYRYMEEHNVQNDSEKELKKYIVLVLGKKYVEYEEID
ncbi:MAG: hypothetical protein A2Y24_08235 [Clostridiales bacterium GWE2_32_10]|nr:MAG: hypothetical protein A2Y24_08235 [Clostridiales bacterium GWE2_32_10]HBY19737.1 hypothetical protein [Clostridiales bacterium]